MIRLQNHQDGTILPVSAQPKAKHNRVLGDRAGALGIAVTAPPDKGKANAAIQAVLADLLGCRPSQLQLIAGASSRSKKFLVQGMTSKTIEERLQTHR